MWKNKRFLVIAAIVAVVLIISIAGVALAQTNDSNSTQGKSFAARVAAMLGIDQQKVEDAFTQAQKDMTNEAMDARLKSLVDSGKITQEQADQYQQWWQSRPSDILPGAGPGTGIGRGGFKMGWCLPRSNSSP
jgi:hypothetical protein